MKKHYYFITGTSRGIGAALADTLLRGSNVLHCYSRSGNVPLQSQARQTGTELHDHLLDLADTTATAQHFEKLFAGIDPAQTASLTLIQNAGLLLPMGKIGQKPDLKGLEKGMVVNLIAPMMITELFVAQFQNWDLDKKVLNISTGAARNPYVAWNMYCSSKAGLDMHSQVLATEQAGHPTPIKVLSLAPGIVDTQMQDLIRTQTVEAFPMLDKFVELKEQNLLVPPATVAQQIVQLLKREDYGEQVLLDLREA